MGALRLFLAVSVLAGHLRYGRGIFGLSFLGGGFAVQCFFIISGFYMALVLNEKYNYQGSYWHFIQQRFLRLYPLYLVVAILILAVEGFITHVTAQPCGIYKILDDTNRWSNPLANCFYGVTNFFILGLDALFFTQQDMNTGQLYLTPYTLPNAWPCTNYLLNGPAWTLSVEMTFYILAPFLVRKSIKVQAAFLLSSFALRSVLFLSLPPHTSFPWTYTFFPSNLFFFMAGSLGYHFYKHKREMLEKFASSHMWLFWVYGLLMLDQGRLPFKEYFFYLYIPFSILMVPLFFAYTRKNKTDRLIGELSYPYYLLHYHVIAVAEFFLHENYDAFFGPLCLFVTFGLTYALYQLIETRTERYRERLFQRIDSSRKLQLVESQA